MNLQKFTQKSLEAIQNAQSNAVEYGNPQLDQQHLLLALLQQEDGLIPGLLQKMNINVNGLTQAVENEVKRLPRVSGGETRVAVDLEKALDRGRKAGRKYDGRICFRRAYLYGNGQCTQCRFEGAVPSVQRGQRRIYENSGNPSVATPE